MKFVIFYEKTEQTIAETIAAIIDAYDCKVTCYQTDAVWNNAAYDKPTVLLQNATHILLIFDANAVAAAAPFLFFIGMGIGMNVPILALLQGKNIPLPDNLKQLVTPLPLDVFEDYFIDEQKSFLCIEEKKLARKELMDKGFPCVNTNFVAAVQDGQYEIVRLFLAAGFNASLRDTRGTPVLSLAIRNAQYDVAALLIASGAAIDSCAEDRSYSALMEAAQLGDLKTAALLLEKHADTNIQSKDGQTALILAVGRQDIPMVQLLSEHHADWLLADSLGMSALAYAKLFRNSRILAFIPDT
ncbi:ankyrin repeat domain-containing protein [Treponema sp.]|uniref:ankyrin repeat domain-containing protein n=1 Tax=Treponema sp. TaxID=166 RepID=UPI003FA1AA63